MPPSPADFCRAVNTLSAWLAQDDFGPQGISELNGIAALLLFGNQVLDTLEAACRLARRAPQLRLLFSGGVGHSTQLLVENLRNSKYGPLVEDGTIRAGMAEAEVFAAVASLSFDIPAARILVERESRNTGENARFSLRLLAEHGLRSGRLLLLQDPTMQRRSVETLRHEAHLAGLDYQVASHAVFVPRVEVAADGSIRLAAGPSRDAWTMERFLGLILGEIERLRDDARGYGPNGKDFLPHVEIPEDVLGSYALATEISRLDDALR
jgi:uncharacterized SAM-binding protein YcdF (DUF218 family)